MGTMKAGRPYVFGNAARELSPAASAAYQAIGISAVIAIPLVKENVLVAGLGVHSATPREWQVHEIELLES